jgi:hypothetical protein
MTLRESLILMRNSPNTSLVPASLIRQKIHFIRGTRVMIDADLARLYGATTANPNKAVKRNLGRFPPDFMFQIRIARFK